MLLSFVTGSAVDNAAHAAFHPLRVQNALEGYADWCGARFFQIAVHIAFPAVEHFQTDAVPDAQEVMATGIRFAQTIARRTFSLNIIWIMTTAFWAAGL